MGGFRGLAVLAVSLVLWGCTGKQDPAQVAELEQVKRDVSALNASLDDVGARLLEGQHRVLADAELRERHQHVSQIACANLSDHWAGINRFLDNQGEKKRKLRSSQVAAADHHRD